MHADLTALRGNLKDITRFAGPHCADIYQGWKELEMSCTQKYCSMYHAVRNVRMSLIFELLAEPLSNLLSRGHLTDEVRQQPIPLPRPNQTGNKSAAMLVKAFCHSRDD